MVHSISLCFMMFTIQNATICFLTRMEYDQYWWTTMDIDGLRWCSGVSAKKLSVLTFWATWPCLKFSSPAGPASFGKKGLCWNCPWAYSSRVSRGVGFCMILCLRSICHSQNCAREMIFYRRRHECHAHCCRAVCSDRQGTTSLLSADNKLWWYDSHWLSKCYFLDKRHGLCPFTLTRWWIALNCTTREPCWEYLDCTKKGWYSFQGKLGKADPSWHRQQQQQNDPCFVEVYGDGSDGSTSSTSSTSSIPPLADLYLSTLVGTLTGADSGLK